MVEVGTELARKNDLANLTYKLGDIEQVPLPDESVDLAILSQALHHARHPQKAVDEAHRILRPGGQLLILELAEHDFEKARELYADLWLGFKESALDGFLKKAGFIKVEVTLRLEGGRRALLRDAPGKRSQGVGEPSGPGAPGSSSARELPKVPILGDVMRRPREGRAMKMQRHRRRSHWPGAARRVHWPISQTPHTARRARGIQSGSAHTPRLLKHT